MRRQKARRRHSLISSRSVTLACISTILCSLILLNQTAVKSTALSEFSDIGPIPSKPLALTKDGATLVIANPESGSISLISTSSLTVTAEISVGSVPRSIAVDSDGTAYIANQGSDTISVVDIKAKELLETIPVGHRPSGIVLSSDERFLVVSESGDDSIHYLEVGTFHTTARIRVSDRPYGLSFTPDSRGLVVSHLLSGQVTRIPFWPYSQFLAQIITSGSPEQAQDQITTASNSAIQVISTWENVAPAPGVVVNRDGSRAYLAQTMANGLGLNNQFDTTVFPKISVIDLSTNVHEKSEHISLPETDRPVGLPWDAALSSDGNQLWVVNSASNDVSIIDISQPKQPRRAGHIPVGPNPRGILFSIEGQQAYVTNSLDGTVSVIDAQSFKVTHTIQVTDIPLPPLLLKGKQLFYSSQREDLAQAAWISCNTCHVEGEHDGRTWQLQFLGQVPPGEEAVIKRNTTSLLGMIQTYPLRWSAEWDESADSEFSIRFEQFGTGLIKNGDMHPTLGSPNQGRSDDLDALAAFIDSLEVPQRQHDYSESELRGKELFDSLETGCSECHPLPVHTDLKVHDVGTADGPGEWFGPLIDTPTLRFLYDSGPYLHDGSAETLYDLLTTANPQDEHGKTSHLTAEQLSDLVAYILAIPADH